MLRKRCLSAAERAASGCLGLRSDMVPVQLDGLEPGLGTEVNHKVLSRVSALRSPPGQEILVQCIGRAAALGRRGDFRPLAV